MSDSTLLGLPYISPSQAQKHVTHNEAVRRLDALVQLSVKSMTLVEPPSDPAEGDRYILPYGATGAWTDHNYQVAAYLDGAWIFLPPRDGWTAWVYDDGLTTTYYDGVWRASGPMAAENILINGNFSINQRQFSGGALAAQHYGHDRWNAGSGGADYTVSNGLVTLNSGRLEQKIESDRLPAGKVICIAADSVSAELTVDIEGYYATIPAGSSRQFTTISLPEALPNPATFSVYANEPVTFSNIAINPGAIPMIWSTPEPVCELLRCQRYFISASSGARLGEGQGPIGTAVQFATTMRDTPSVSLEDEHMMTGLDSSSFSPLQISPSGFLWEIDTTPSGSAQNISCWFTYHADAEL